MKKIEPTDQGFLGRLIAEIRELTEFIVWPMADIPESPVALATNPGLQQEHGDNNAVVTCPSWPSNPQLLKLLIKLKAILIMASLSAKLGPRAMASMFRRAPDWLASDEALDTELTELRARLKPVYKSRLENTPVGRDFLKMLDRHSTMPPEELEGRYKSYDDWITAQMYDNIDDSETIVSLAGEYEAAGHDGFADDLCEVALLQGAYPEDLHSWRGDRLFDFGQFDKAADQWKRALKLNGECQPALLGLAIYYRSQDNYPEIIPLLEIACRQDEQNTLALILLIEAYFHVDRFDDAESRLPALQQLDSVKADEIQATIMLFKPLSNDDISIAEG